MRAPARRAAILQVKARLRRASLYKPITLQSLGEVEIPLRRTPCADRLSASRDRKRLDGLAFRTGRMLDLLVVRFMLIPDRRRHRRDPDLVVLPIEILSFRRVLLVETCLFSGSTHGLLRFMPSRRDPISARRACTLPRRA
jgi:hypothetical protein